MVVRSSRRLARAQLPREKITTGEPWAWSSCIKWYVGLFALKLRYFSGWQRFGGTTVVRPAHDTDGMIRSLRICPCHRPPLIPYQHSPALHCWPDCGTHLVFTSSPCLVSLDPGPVSFLSTHALDHVCIRHLATLSRPKLSLVAEPQVRTKWVVAQD